MMIETKEQEEGANNFVVEQKEGIKITKNTKGYNFEFRILSLNIEEMDRVHNENSAKIKEWEKRDEAVDY